MDLCRRCGHHLTEDRVRIQLDADTEISLCGGCRDDLRAWLGLLPPGTDLAAARHHYPQLWSTT